jgi:hypothetical protein
MSIAPPLPPLLPLDEVVMPALVIDPAAVNRTAPPLLPVVVLVPEKIPLLTIFAPAVMVTAPPVPVPLVPRSALMWAVVIEVPAVKVMEPAFPEVVVFELVEITPVIMEVPAVKEIVPPLPALVVVTAAPRLLAIRMSRPANMETDPALVLVLEVLMNSLIMLCPAVKEIFCPLAVIPEGTKMRSLEEYSVRAPPIVEEPTLMMPV